MTDAEDGFSTLESLVAFAILSLGLLLAVQSISQSATSLRRSTEARWAMEMLQRIRADELPLAAKRYAGAPLRVDGDFWRIDAGPLIPGDAGGPIRYSIRIKRQGSLATIFSGVMPSPPREIGDHVQRQAGP